MTFKSQVLKGRPGGTVPIGSGRRNCEPGSTLPLAAVSMDTGMQNAELGGTPPPAAALLKTKLGKANP